LRTSKKTHHGMLPQFHALETTLADKGTVTTKRDVVAQTGAQPGEERLAIASDTQKEQDTNPVPIGVPGRETSPERGQLKVFVVDKNKKPLSATTPARARKLLISGRAKVHHVLPFVIRLKDRKAEESVVKPLVAKIDPGGTYTGITVTQSLGKGLKAVYFIELIHRGLQIKLALQKRASLRRGRRSRKTRYRKPRWNNRIRKVLSNMGVWLPPSLRHRIEGIMAWIRRLSKWASITEVWVESVRFDMQKLVNPEISGVAYQQGTLFGYELREYLLEKYNRECVYCGKGNVPLNIDHVVPKSKGGTDKVSNLVLACIPCNQKKSNKSLEEFASKKVADKVKKQLKMPLRDAAAVNTTRKALVNELSGAGYLVRTGTGAQTKYNRSRFNLPKDHVLDALCVGDVDNVVSCPSQKLIAKSMGRGSYARTRSDKYGFPRLVLSSQKKHFGFQTGDIVRAVVPKGKHKGVHFGRVAVRATGGFNITTRGGTVQGISHKYCRLVQRGDGYAYEFTEVLL